MAIDSGDLVGGGGGGGLFLAPDLTFPSSALTGVNYKSTGVIIASAGLTTILSLTGKFTISYLRAQGMNTNPNSIVKLTIDGEVKWNDTYTPAADSTTLFGAVTDDGVASAIEEAMQCEASFLLEMHLPGDANGVTLLFAARPIL